MGLFWKSLLFTVSENKFASISYIIHNESAERVSNKKQGFHVARRLRNRKVRKRTR